MSAFIVGKDHIDAMVTLSLYAPTYGPMHWYVGLGQDPRPGATSPATHEQADEIGRMLWAENVRSVQGRYPDTVEGGVYPGPNDFSAAEVFAYRWQRTETLSPVEGLSIIGCYEYQSCEHDEWHTSEAYAFCDALRKRLIHQLPGMEFAPWEYTRPSVGGVA